jgi:hypothetical protein
MSGHCFYFNRAKEAEPSGGNLFHLHRHSLSLSFSEISHAFTATSKCNIALSLEVISQRVQVKYKTDFQLPYFSIDNAHPKFSTFPLMHR